MSEFFLNIVNMSISASWMEHVIAHEQAHINRKDHWWKPLGFLILTLHWFNPLMWLGYVLLCRDIELACDEKVIKELNTEQKADYSQALLTCSVNRRMIAACPIAFGEVGVKNRVKSVLNYKKPAFWIVITAIVASVVVAVCFLTNPRTTIMSIIILLLIPYPLRPAESLKIIREKEYGVTHFTELHRTLHKNFLIWRCQKSPSFCFQYVNFFSLSKIILTSTERESII